MNLVSRLLAVGAVVGVAGCGLGGTFHVDPFLDEDTSGLTPGFQKCLVEEYQRRTGVEKNVDMNWVHAGKLAKKGYMAMSGPVDPWVPSNYNVAPKDLPELERGRSRLMSALAKGKGGSIEQQCACARAQVYYDGWLEQSHDNDLGPGFRGVVQPDYQQAEKAAFYEAVVLCEGLPADPKTFVIYFGWDKFNLTAAAVAVVDEIVDYANGFDSTMVMVAGHTDTSGSNAYNQGLSERRTNTVVNALESRGVDVTSTSSFGETRPAVPTGDGVREPLNRRAEVTVKPN